MATVEIKGIKELTKRFKLGAKIAISKTLRSKDLRNSIGNVVENDIRKNFNEKASSVTQSFREYFEQFNSTHPDYKRSKINITFTGDLLRDLATNVKFNVPKGLLVIAHSDKKHKRLNDPAKTFSSKTAEVSSLKTKKVRKVTIAASHKDISKAIQKRGFDYIKITPDAERQIIVLIQKTLLNNLRKELS